MTKTIRIATHGVADDYGQSLVPLIIESLGYKIAWTRPQSADLIIFGPFSKRDEKKHRWLPKPLRPMLSAVLQHMQPNHRPVTLFQTGENLRHNHIPCDYSLSFDLAVVGTRHCRLPYWMEMVDWRHEGVSGNRNPRFGQLLNINRLMQPLGREFLQKPFQAAIFASHLQEPRETLFNAVRRAMPVHGFGPYFDSAIKHHSMSGITKQEVLKGYAFNLCPENSMYPGYYTEKIPEAFMAGSLPVTWVDSNVSVDFNPNAMLNLAPMMQEDFKGLEDLLLTKSNLEKFAGEHLIHHRPTIENLKTFIQALMQDALH